MRTKEARTQMPPEFFEWLDGKEEELGINDYQLASRAGLSSSVFSKARSGTQAISWDACDRIAQALNVPSETVLRLAGLLPAEMKFDPELEEMVGKLGQLSKKDAREVLALIDAKIRSLEDGED